MRYGAAAGLAVIIGNAEGVLDWVVLLGAAVTGLSILHSKVVRPLVRFGRRADEGVDILLALPKRMDELERRVEAVEGRLDHPPEVRTA